MPPVNRVLSPEAVPDLEAYMAEGGGAAITVTREAGGDAVLRAIEASGLRGRGGGGFPTGVKWRAVVDNRSPSLPPTVVVNAAEGEPGSFKDRTLLQRNPYRVLEGMVVAAATVGARTLVVAMKGTFTEEIVRVRAALEEVREAGWTEGLEVAVVEGPSEYLYGEETALLEVIGGRAPFPRLAPPFRHGTSLAGEFSETTAGRVMASDSDSTAAPPALVNNVETFANVAGIVANGPDWFREMGTEKSPGTIVCTVSGRVQRHGVAEFPMGTPLAEIIETIGGGPEEGRELVAAMSGVANPLLPAALFSTPATYEDMQEAGAGLGAAGFIVFDDRTDFAAVAAGVSRFLAVESCGQCTPCKQDGRALSELTDRIRRSEADPPDLTAVEDHVRTVAEEARCFLASQHQRVLSSILELFGDAVAAHTTGGPAADEDPIIPIAGFDDDGGRFVLDEKQRRKQPDWSYDEEDSGQAPADRVNQRAGDLAGEDADA
ncbi:MAG: SLBB domain-containing protein [Actinobacteria bacterium]|nr:SLBB domain-containing protein [Actinomycetota bacterium]